MESTPEAALSAIIEKVGGTAALSRLLGLHRTAVHKWRRVPGERVGDVARVTGLRPEDIRPDIYPRRASTPAEAA
jgi:DNA-binding transcriptional regulator YdaS (Cro superfamily)